MISISIPQTNLPRSREDPFDVPSCLIAVNFIQRQGAHPSEIYTFFLSNLLLPAPEGLVNQITMGWGEEELFSSLK